ncbi:MAG: DnaA N-terminal domain-containing protein, partial [Castellaniella sp.]
MNEFWQACVQRLEQELPPQQINAWIRPLVPLDYDEELAVLRIGAPNRFKLDWVRKNFSTRLESMASDWYSQAVQVHFELSASPGRTDAPAAAPRPAPAAPGPARSADAG